MFKSSKRRESGSILGKLALQSRMQKTIKVSNKTSKKRSKTVAKKAEQSGDLVSLNKYHQELEASEKNKNKKKGNNQNNTADNENNKKILSLDNFLQKRMEQKNREFIRLQKEKGFYFSPALDEQLLRQQKENEGMFLLAVNLSSLFSLLTNRTKIPDVSNASISIIGEYVDKPEPPTRIQDMFITDPEYQINPLSSINNITISSRTRDQPELSKNIKPSNLVKLVQYMYEKALKPEHYRQTLIATAVIYKHVSNGLSIPDFFKSKTEIPISTIRDLEEFYRSWDIFNEPSELRELENNILNMDIEKNVTNIANNENRPQSSNINEISK